MNPGKAASTWCLLLGTKCGGYYYYYYSPSRLPALILTFRFFLSVCSVTNCNTFIYYSDTIWKRVRESVPLLNVSKVIESVPDEIKPREGKKKDLART